MNGGDVDGGGPVDAAGAVDAVGRVAREVGGMAVVDRLAALSGSDFTTVMLEVARRRAARETPASVLRRYQRDRFVRPGSTSWPSFRRAEDALLGCVPPEVEIVPLAPLVPLGTHSALATVSQHKVVTTIRACEVAADPTNALALEAAARRAPDRSGSGVVRLAAVQRVERAQRFPAGWAAHFGLFATVTAGRDRGDRRFERSAVGEQFQFAFAALRAAGVRRVQVALTPLSEAGERLAAETVDAYGDGSGDIVMDRERAGGRGYYRDLCFKVNALVGGKVEEIGDGGFTDWTARLLSNDKERLLIAGYGVERLASVAVWS